MKATTRVGLVPILVGLVVVLSCPGLTGADGGGANVVRGDECTISLAELGGGDVTTRDTQSVETPSGNVSLVCRADLPDGLDPPPHTVRTSGELCETPLGPTTDTEKVIIPAGKVRLTCHVNGRARPPATGWAAGDSVGDGYGVIIHTTDGGETWVRQGKVGEIPDVNLERVSAIDAQNAWVVGNSTNGYGLILRTHNGGRTWQRQGSPEEILDAALIGAFALDRKTAWVAGISPTADEPGVILHTSDGGQTWVQQGLGTVPPAHLEGVYASDADHAWVVGGTLPEDTGIILRTTDGGATWDKWTADSVEVLSRGHLIDIHGVDADTVWAVGTGMVVHTADGGRTWVDQTDVRMSPVYDVNGVFAVDHSTVWVVVDGGGIYRSDDGGAHWVKQNAPAGATGDYILRISAVDERAAWAVGRGMRDEPGHVLHTADGGQTWTIQATRVEADWWGVSFVR